MCFLAEVNRFYSKHVTKVICGDGAFDGRKKQREGCKVQMSNITIVWYCHCKKKKKLKNFLIFPRNVLRAEQCVLTEGHFTYMHLKKCTKITAYKKEFN